MKGVEYRRKVATTCPPGQKALECRLRTQACPKGTGKMADDYGLSSPQAIDFSKHCDKLSSKFNALEDDYLTLRQELIQQ